MSASSTSPQPDWRTRRLHLAVLGCLLIATTFIMGCSLSLDIRTDEGRRSIPIHADRGWQDTGVVLREGEEVIVQAISGRWFEDPEGVWHDASGGPDPWICGTPDCHEPLPQQPKYALIARVGEEGDPLLVGDFLRFFPRETGRLYLRANYGDIDIPIHNPEGQLTVRISFE